MNNKFIEYDELGSGALVYNEVFALNKEQWQAMHESLDQLIGRRSCLMLMVVCAT